MKSKKWISLVVLFALVWLMILSTGSTMGAPKPNSARAQDAWTPPFAAPANPGTTDLAIQGTMWQPQTRGSFSLWQPLGWGTATRLKANKPADQWVHIGVPLLTYIESKAQKVLYVEFCATSSNGAATKPTRMDVWDNDKSIGSYTVTWPADNAYHCFGHNYGAGAWRSTLGISVQLHFANSTDTITLHKAWVHTSD
jgi:hypothetical protein